MKQTIRLKERELKQLIGEAIRTTLTEEETKLKRLYYNYDYEGYHWSISKITYPELDILTVVDESSRGN